MAESVALGQVEHDSSSVVTIGTFDGVHLGHQALVRYVVERARAQGGRSRVLTFEPHPREVVRGERMAVLSSLDERTRWLGELGVDEVIIVPFTSELSQMSAADFVDRILVDQVGLQEIVVGYDFAFGYGREGNGGLLEKLGQARGFRVNVVGPQTVEHLVVSSREIRRRLSDEGDVHGAAQLLGRPYELTAFVTRGDGRGRQIGYPTANLEPVDARKVVPAIGVYAVLVNNLPDGTSRGGMLNVGLRPTFNGRELRIEVHLFDFRGNLYGEELRTLFVERVRPERRFASVGELTAQLSQDEKRCRTILLTVS